MGWIKYFANKTIITEPASWSRTNLTGMVAAAIEYKDIKISIEGIGNFWQSDDYICVAGNHQPSMIKRRIELQLNESHKFMIYTVNMGHHKLQVTNYHMANGSPINSNQIGKWLVIELDLITGKQTHYINGERI